MGRVASIGEDVVEAVAPGGCGEGRPASDGIVDAYDREASVPTVQRFGEAGHFGNFLGVAGEGTLGGCRWFE